MVNHFCVSLVNLAALVFEISCEKNRHTDTQTNAGEILILVTIIGVGNNR